MNPIRTAVIGVGHQGRRHAEKLGTLENSQLVAVCDIDAGRCEAAGSQLGVAALADFQTLLGDVDAVVVATPTPTHFEIAITCLANGIHVLLEKPITASIDEARRLVSIASENDVILQVGHLERFNPAIMAMSPHVDKPQFIESLRIAPYQLRGIDVSVVLDLMIHDIDLIHSFVCSEMIRVDATGRSIFTDHIDIANARIQFANGCVANVTSSRISFKTERTLRLFQSNAYFSADLYNKSLTLYRKTGEGPARRPEDIAIERWSGDGGDAMREQARAFLGSIAGGKSPLVSGRIALEALETAAAIGRQIGGQVGDSREELLKP